MLMESPLPFLPLPPPCFSDLLGQGFRSYYCSLGRFLIRCFFYTFRLEAESLISA